MRVRRLALAAVCLLALFALCGCRAEVDVVVDVSDDGSGVVRVGVGLDQAAQDAIPEVERELRLADLAPGGWTVSGPAVEADDLLWIRASKPFDTPEQAVDVLEEVWGPDGPLRDLELRRHRRFLSTTYEVEGTLDLADGPAVFADAALLESLGGTVDAVDAAEIDVELTVLLPGRVGSNAPSEVEGASTWPAAMGETVELRARSTQWSAAVTMWTVLAASAALVLLWMAGRGLVRRRRR